MEHPVWRAPSMRPPASDANPSATVADPRIALTLGQVQALRNLQKKSIGEGVEFVNIGDARALTNLGFATRTQEGWEVTASGLDRLTRETPEQGPDASLIAFRGRGKTLRVVR